MTAGDKKVKKIQLPFKEKKCVLLETQPRNTLTSLLVFCILWRLQESTENGGIVIFCSSAQLYQKTPKLAWERERDLWSTKTICSAFLIRVFAATCLGMPSTYLLCAHSRHTLLPCGSRQRPREWATLLQIGKDRLGRSSLPNPGFSVLIKACWTRERLDSIWQCYPLYKRQCEEVNYII